MTELDRLGWAVSRSYDIGGSRLAIRCTSEAFGLLLDEALERYRVEGIAAPTRYSIVIGDEAGGTPGTERYHILYRGTIALVKAMDPSVVVQMLLKDLETLQLSERSDAMYADMVPLSVGDRTALVPEVLVPFIGTLGNRRVSRAGLQLPIDTAVAIDPAAGQIQPVEPMLEVAPKSVEWGSGNGDLAGRAVLDRPTRVDALISIGWGDEPIEPVSKGLALYRLASHVANLWTFGQRGLEGLRDLVDGANCYEMGSKKPAEMLQALLSTLRQD